MKTRAIDSLFVAMVLCWAAAAAFVIFRVPGAVAVFGIIIAATFAFGLALRTVGAAVQKVFSLAGELKARQPATSGEILDPDMANA